MKATNIRRLLAAIRADPRGRRWLLLSQAALVGQVVFDLLIPQAIRNLVNNGILAGDIDAVVNGALSMAVFAVASAAFATGVAWFAAQLGEEVGHRLRSSVYRRVTQLSWGNVDRLETSGHRGPRRPAPTASSPRCRAATTRSWPAGAPASARASASPSPSPASCWPTGRS